MLLQSIILEINILCWELVVTLGPSPALPAKYAQKWECEWQYVAEYSWELCNLNVNDDGAAL